MRYCDACMLIGLAVFVLFSWEFRLLRSVWQQEKEMEVYQVYLVHIDLLCLCLGQVYYISFPLGLMTFTELRKRVLATSGKTRQDVSE